MAETRVDSSVTLGHSRFELAGDHVPCGSENGSAGECQQEHQPEGVRMVELNLGGNACQHDRDEAENQSVYRDPPSPARAIQVITDLRQRPCDPRSSGTQPEPGVCEKESARYYAKVFKHPPVPTTG